MPGGATREGFDGMRCATTCCVVETSVHQEQGSRWQGLFCDAGRDAAPGGSSRSCTPGGAASSPGIKVVADAPGRQAGVPSVPHVIGRVSSYDELSALRARRRAGRRPRRRGRLWQRRQRNVLCARIARLGPMRRWHSGAAGNQGHEAHPQCPRCASGHRDPPRLLSDRPGDDEPGRYPD